MIRLLETIAHSGRLSAASVAACVVAISLLHYLTPGTLALWDNLFQHLYFLPVVIASIRFGWRGGVAAAALAGIGYAANVALTSAQEQPFSGYLASQSAEVIDFFLVGIVAGLLAEREKRQKRAVERASMELAAVYRELQDNFEQMKRSERLYAIGQLSAGLAHEIRNPLASIAGAAPMLRKEALSGARRSELVEIIERECRRLNHLLTSFLDFARPRSPQYKPVDAGQLLNSVITLAAHAPSGGRLKLRAEVAPGLPTLECDQEQLQQVVLNLVINAMQAMPEGGEVVLAARTQHGNVVIEVTDQGPGIPQESLDKIFDPFFTTKENGTGLGLSVGHQIVEQHGGSLSAKNNEGGGATFTIVLPARRPQGQ